MPSGETAGSFSRPAVDTSKRASPRSVSISHMCKPGWGRGTALSTRRLSGSQLNAGVIPCRSGTGDGTWRGAPVPSGSTQNSDGSVGVSADSDATAHTPSFEPSGEKCSVACE